MKWLLIFTLLVSSPVLVEHAGNLWRAPQYQFFPILLLCIFALAKPRLQTFNAVRCNAHPWHSSTFFVAISGYILLLFATLGRSPNVAVIAVLLAFVPIVTFYSRTGESLWPVWALGWLLVRLPFGIEGKLVNNLQLLSSWTSSQFLDIIGVNHLMTGNILRLSDRELFVDEACSGVVSLFSIVSFGLLYAVWQKHGLLRLLLLVFAGIVWTFLLNTMRISSIAIVDQWWGLDWAHGWQHTALGLSLFGVTLGGFYLTDQLLEVMLAPIPDGSLNRDLNWLERAWNYLAERPREDEEDDEQSQYKDIDGVDNEDAVSNNSENVPSWGWQSYIISLLLVCCIGINVTRWYLLSNRDYSAADSVRVAAKIDDNSLYRSVQSTDFELIQRDPESPFGAFSKVFRLKDSESSFSIDYPFFGGWHELTYCYQGAGWTPSERRVNNDSWPFVMVDLENEQGQFGYLWFSLVFIDGTPVQTPNFGWNLNELKTNFLMRAGNGLVGEAIQLQLWHPTSSPLTEQERLELEEQFIALRQIAFEEMFFSQHDSSLQ